MNRQPARTFRDLLVWQKAHRLVLTLYEVSATFPVEELYGLRAQLRRAAVSVAGNIAEGFKRASKRDKARMLNIAEASLEETRYYLLLTSDLGYAATTELLGQVDEVGRVLSAYTREVRASAERSGSQTLPRSVR